jgi:muconate cycloisomerase
MFLGSGLTDPGISLAATLQLYAAFGYERPAALNGPQFMDTSVLAQPLEPANGKLTVPSGPGLGIEVDEEKVRALMVDL